MHNDKILKNDAVPTYYTRILRPNDGCAWTTSDGSTLPKTTSQALNWKRLLVLVSYFEKSFPTGR